MADRSFEHSQKRVKPAGEAEVAWINDLLRVTRNVTLLTERQSVDGKFKAHATTLYSAFTRRLTGDLQAVWRSRETSLHSRNIALDCRVATALGRRAVTDVGFNLYNSSSPNVSLEMRGWARRVDDQEEAAAALAVVNDWRRQRAGEPPRSLEPENSYSRPYAMYTADIYQATIPADVELMVPGEGIFPVDYGHAPVDLRLLRDFELAT